MCWKEVQRHTSRFHHDCGWLESASRPVRLPVPILCCFERSPVSKKLLERVVNIHCCGDCNSVACVRRDEWSDNPFEYRGNSDKITLSFVLWTLTIRVRFPIVSINWCVCVEMCIRQLQILKYLECRCLDILAVHRWGESARGHRQPNDHRIRKTWFAACCIPLSWLLLPERFLLRCNAQIHKTALILCPIENGMLRGHHLIF